MADKYTTFKEMYDFFLSGITDDMFMELTREDTEEILQEILFAALPHFEFPRKDIFDVDLEDKRFTCRLSLEEMRIIRDYMIAEWICYQLASIENVRQKYSGSDFSFTSQANHIARLVSLQQHYMDDGFRLQRLYSRRRRGEDGVYVSTWDEVMGDANDVLIRRGLRH